MSSNTYNFTGRPQVSAQLSNVFDSNSFYSNGGNFCPIPQCTPALLKNGNCNPVCNISQCDYDGGDCICPIDTCNISSRGNGVCDIGCATAGCFYDHGDCCDVELCPLHLRGNQKCDPECNNKACEYDGGECTVPTNSSARVTLSSREQHSVDGVIWTPHRDAQMEKAHFESKFRSSSVLETAVGSNVLSILESYKTKAIQIHSSPFHTKGLDSGDEPSSIKCGNSNFRIENAFIDADPKRSSIQSNGCIGLKSCGSCDACSRCSSNGCDSSYYDAFCRSQIGASSKCVVTTPSPENDFASMSCLKPTIPMKVDPESNLGFIIVIVIGCVCCFGLLFFAARKYRTLTQARSQNSSNDTVASFVDVMNHPSRQTTESSPVNLVDAQPSFVRRIASIEPIPGNSV